jgi:hypothetical protein
VNSDEWDDNEPTLICVICEICGYFLFGAGTRTGFSYSSSKVPIGKNGWFAVDQQSKPQKYLTHFEDEHEDGVAST